MGKTDILQGIRAEKEACFALFKELNKTLTVPSQDPALHPKHKYSLRGVITSPDVLYMCTRRFLDPQNSDHTEDRAQDQWCRVSWLAEGANIEQVCGNGLSALRRYILTKTFTTQHTTFDKVKEAMFKELDANGNRAPILVYATEEAVEEQSLELSSALQV